MSEEHSILVCGTGIVGLACALGLSRAGVPVRLLGPRRAPAMRTPEDFDPRVYALSAASQRLLDGLGAWRLMDERRLTAVEAMEIHGDGGGMIDLSAWQDARHALAWIVESGEMERALQQAVQFMGIPWDEDHFAALQSAPKGMEIRTAKGAVRTVALVVGADGGRSLVRQAAGIEHRYVPYGDMGVVAHVNLDMPHQHTAWQWFTGDSVFAVLPLPDTAHGAQGSLVWSMPEGQAREWLAMAPADQQRYFASHARAITGGRLGELTLRTAPQGFPLSLERSAMVAQGVALAGDAAHRIHPLAGQGLNLGLGDVRTLVEVQRGKEPFRSPGDLRVLDRYRRRRAEAVWTMGWMTHGLHRLFGTHHAPLAWARNRGMRLVDGVPFVKRRLIRAASGN